ncbi:MAG: leucine--tRNA ligase [Euryarchaeota archaeon]|nr:leucine--tRNA ligase [Euryarchaeota archaeon]
MEQETYNYIVSEQKWQKQWFDDKLYEATKKNKKKFFIHFAYPGVSGYLHVGHMRGFTYCDVIARYKKMIGYDVLFPAGFHASGIPSISFSKKIERKDETTIRLLKENGCTDAFIKKLTDPKEVINYFSHVYVEDYWKRFGFLIDYTRLMNTISEGYNQFIIWQFHKLNEHGLLIQKPHFAPYCPQCGPVAVDKSETDVSKGGNAEVLEFTIIKFILSDGTILPAATLRPETIFGVTNMWVNPEVLYQKVKINNETWICSEQCVDKLTYQLDDVKPLPERISGKDLLGKTCKIPIVNREVPILPGLFADPTIATGIVMSVPAHAPYDWVALVESKEHIDPITIIDVQGFGTNPAKEICDQLGIKSQKETQKLDEATDIIYKKEFHTGYLNNHCGQYAKIKVSDIKDTVKNDLITKNLGVVLREFSQDVLCRCGERVQIKQIPDQWFIKYSDETLTANSKEHVETMNIYPEEYKQELPKILDWFGDRAVIRKGSWLGTEFPFKKDWIIEPISDSTLYPAYYIISKYVNQKLITPTDMTLEFFDYIFLGKGKPKQKIWDVIRSDFLYWYPVDINLGGKEHKTVHFPVFLMNHVAIMPTEFHPKGIFVHWWVTQKGKEKISKSKGGAEPILQAATLYGVDAMRLYYTHVGAPFVDVEWDPEIVTKYKNRILGIWKLAHQIQNCKNTEQQNLDHWLQSMVQRRIQIITEAMEHFDLRVAANEIFFELQKDILWYLKRGGGNKKILKNFITTWVRLMTPITPHIAEELWHLLRRKGYVSIETYPAVDPKLFSEQDEVGEYLLSKAVDDINEILKVTNIKAKKIYIYVSPGWKQQLFTIALQLSDQGKLDMGTLMKTALADPKLKALSKSVSQFAGSLVGDIKKLNETDRKRYRTALDEQVYLKSAQTFFATNFSAEVIIFSADDEKRYDPVNKARFATPLRPAIYVE